MSESSMLIAAKLVNFRLDVMQQVKILYGNKGITDIASRYP